MSEGGISGKRAWKRERERERKKPRPMNLHPFPRSKQLSGPRSFLTAREFFSSHVFNIAGEITRWNNDILRPESVTRMRMRSVEFSKR